MLKYHLVKVTRLWFWELTVEFNNILGGNFTSGSPSSDTWLEPSPDSPSSDTWLEPSPIHSPIQSPNPLAPFHQLECPSFNPPGATGNTLVVNNQLDLNDDPIGEDQMDMDTTGEDQMDVDVMGLSINGGLEEQDKNCEFHTKDPYKSNSSNEVEAWILEPDLAHMYISVKGRALRVCIHRDPEDNLFHCTCGYKLVTAEAVQRHGRESQDKDHPMGFFSLFTDSKK